MRRCPRTLIALLLFAMPGHAMAQTLTIGVGAAPTSADPHYSVLTPNVSLASHSYDALINRDATSKPVPGLALAWKMLDDTTWEFKLHPGVKFHNGDDFTAADVAHTIARVPKVVNSPGGFGIYTRTFTDVIVVDPHTVRLKTAAVYPLAPVDLREVKIISRATGPTPFVQGPNGETLDKNPLNDLRVRQALSLAINRVAIVERMMENAAIPSAQFLPPGSYSYVPDLKPPPYDPQRAKQLLSEAGFPNGLRITLHGPNDRYVNDGKIIQAVGQMWTRIGVQTQVEPITFPNFIARVTRLEFSAFFLGWATSSGAASNPLRALVATVNPDRGRGSSNRGRYSNPVTDHLIEQAMITADDSAREKLLQEATRIAVADVAFIPLHNQMNIWGMSPKYNYTARQDEETHAMSIHPAQ